MFSTGQVVEGAVNYTASNAVCGEGVTGDSPQNATNQTNLTLPAGSNCAQPIGPIWVASITNWLCFVIDQAGLTFRAGTLCQDPLLLFNAILALIAQATIGKVIGFGGGAAGNPPPNTLGNNGDYALSHYDGNMYGPKAAGVWPALPAYWGNNHVLNVNTNEVTILNYNQMIKITGSVSLTTNLPTPVGGANYEFIIVNDSGIDQTLTTPAGVFSGSPNFTGNSATITIVANQYLLLRSDNANWRVICDNIRGGGSGAYSLVDCSGNPITSGSQVVTCSEYAGGYSLNDCSGNPIAKNSQVVTCSEYNGGYSLNDCSGNPISSGSQVLTCSEAANLSNPFVTTGVGAALVCSNPGTNVVASELLGLTGAFTFEPDDGGGYLYITFSGDSEVGQLTCFDSRWTSSSPPGTWEVRTITCPNSSIGESYGGEAAIIVCLRIS